MFGFGTITFTYFKILYYKPIYFVKNKKQFMSLLAVNKLKVFYDRFEVNQNNLLSI